MIAILLFDVSLICILYDSDQADQLEQQVCIKRETTFTIVMYFCYAVCLAVAADTHELHPGRVEDVVESSSPSSMLTDSALDSASYADVRIPQHIFFHLNSIESLNLVNFSKS